MENFVFHNPVRIIFGREIIPQIGAEVSAEAKKVLLLYGQGSIKKNGIYEQVCESLKSAQIAWIDCPGISPNPTITQVREGVALCRENHLQAVLAVGGGSVIDAGKAICAGVCYEGDVWDGFAKKATWNQAIPLYTLLTLSATGSEMNGATVISNQELQTKASFYSSGIFPKASFIDPSLQNSLPLEQTIFGAMDMMAHVLEFYFNGTPNTDLQDYFAEGLMKTILKQLDLVLQNPHNYEARAQLVWAGTLALNGLNGAGRGTGDFSSHRIGHALSACYNLTHGATLSIVMPAWMRYVYKNDIPKFARFGREVFGFKGSDEDTASKGIHAFQEWIRKMGLPLSLVDVGIRMEAIHSIARNPSIPYPLGKIMPLSIEDVEGILRLSNY
jgi:alcohol dehydrogenase